MKSHSLLTIDQLRQAVINLIPIPEVPGIVNDVVDIFVQMGLYASEGVTTAQVLNTIRQSTTGLKGQIEDAKQGGRRTRRRIMKKHLIIRHQARRKTRKSRRKSRRRSRKSRRR